MLNQAGPRSRPAHSNQPLRKAAHQLNKTMGSVASNPHSKGKVKSAIRLREMKVSQKILFCTELYCAFTSTNSLPA